MSELYAHGLKLSPKKCSFANKSLEYLRFQIGKTGDNREYGYTPSLTKIIAIKDFKAPKTAKDV